MGTIRRAVLVLAILLISACSKEEAPPPVAEPAAEPASAPEPEPAAEPPAVEPAPDVMRTVAPDAMQWQDVPGAGGAQMAMMHTHPETMVGAFLLKAPAGWSHPNHFHTANFHRVLLDGDMEVTLTDGSKIASKKGDYFWGAANLIHSSSTKEGFTVFIVTEGQFGTIDVDDAGKPKKADDPVPGEVVGKTRQVAAADLEWKDIPEAKGVQVAPVGMNEETKVTAVFLKFPAAFASGPHTHKSSFHRVTLDGELTVPIEGRPSTPGVAGEYFRGIKDVVHDGTSKAGGTIFLVSDGEWGTVMLDAEGNPKAIAE